MPSSNYVSPSLCVAILLVQPSSRSICPPPCATRVGPYLCGGWRVPSCWLFSWILWYYTTPPSLWKTLFVNIFFTIIFLPSDLLLIFALIMCSRLLSTPFRVDWDADEYQRTYFELTGSLLSYLLNFQKDIIPTDFRRHIS